MDGTGRSPSHVTAGRLGPSTSSAIPSTSVSRHSNAGADALLLDNMTPDVVSACVAAAEVRQGGQIRRTLLEVSGGITLDLIADYAGTGVDMISVGAITNSAPVLDIGFDLR